MTDRSCLARGFVRYVHVDSVVRSSLINQALIFFSSRTISHSQLSSHSVTASSLSTNKIEISSLSPLRPRRSCDDLRADVSSRVSSRVYRRYHVHGMISSASGLSTVG